MRPLLHRWLIAGIALMVLMSAKSAWAQLFEEGFRRLSFATPGARAAGMGRTFIGLADDATASVSNPAGLLALTRPQIYAEFTSTVQDAEFSLGGTENALSFFNVTLPLGTRVAVGFHRHVFLDDRSLVEFRNFGFERDLEGTSYAGSVAIALDEKFHAGLTLSADRMSGFSEFLDFRDPLVLRDDFDEIDIGATIGMLYRPVEAFSVGAVYTYVSDDLEDLPDRIGVGVSWRPAARWLGLLDVVKLTDGEFEVHAGGEYNLTTGQTPIFVRGGLTTVPETAFAPQKLGATLGAGFVLGTHVQADAAYVWSEFVREFVVSMAVRF